MSKKDFNRYVSEISNQYEEFKKVLEQVSLEAQNTQTDIDFVEKLKQQIIPYKQNYERVMYLKYLLYLPEKKEKSSKTFDAVYSEIKEIDESNSPNAVLKENAEILVSIKNSVK